MTDRKAVSALFRQDLRTPAFLLLATGVYVFAWSVHHLLPVLDRGARVSVGLTLDLTLVVPGFFFLLVARPRRWPLSSVAPLVVLGLLTAHFVVPPEHRASQELLRGLPMVLELALLAWIGSRTSAALRRLRAGRGAGPMDARRVIREVTRAVVGASAAAEVLAFELAVLYYGLLAWRAPLPPAQQGERFTAYRRNGYTQVMIGLIMVMVCELFAGHVLVQTLWNKAAAWTLTGLGVYGVVWFLGDWQALRRRPIELKPEALELRVGLRWDLTLPYGRIRSVRRLTGVVRKGPGLDVSVLGSPTFELELTEPVEAVGVYGRRKKADTIRFQVDDPDELETRLRARLDALLDA